MRLASPRFVPAALALSAATALTTALTTAGLVALPRSTAHAADQQLGLPALSQAQRYVLAPPGRTVRPIAVRESSGVNADFVTAASRTSEVSAHGLRAGTSDTAQVGGVAVRRAGVGVAGGWFSYALHVAPHRAVELRVEEAGSADAAYDVLVDGVRVHTRTQRLYAAQGRPIGPTHYRIRVPARLVHGREVVVTFRNTSTPGDGARIAAVWANGERSAGEPGYGAVASTPAGALRPGGHTRLSSEFFGRPYVVYDFGREVGGKVRLDASHVTGDPRLGLAFSESDTFMTTASDYSQDPSGVATETHYVDLDGAGTVKDPVIRGGFRYLMVFLDSPGRADISGLRLRFTADPTNPRPAAYAGSFLSSDKTLNRLWYSGAYSVQMATIASDTGRPYPATPGPVANDQVVAPGDVFLSDGAKRDRLDWGGDNVVSNTVAYLSTGETEPAANSLEWFAAHPSADGQVPGVYLPEPAGFSSSWGEYAAWWTENFWTHYLYTGDRAFLEKWFPTLVDNVGWFEDHVGDDGLWDVPADAGGHWGYGQSGKETYDNLVYAHSLTAAASAATAMGRDDLAAQWTAASERTGAAVNDDLWDAGAGAYREIDGSDAHPLDANALAVASGVADPARARSVLSFIEDHLATEHGDRGVDTTDGSAVPDYISPFVAGQELDAYARAGDQQGAMSVLRRTWSHMLSGRDSTGTFWETVSPTGGLGLGSYTSMSHGWAAAPTSYLTQQTLGVTPRTPGYASFDVSPHPVAGLHWAEGSVPTPHGEIRAAWRMSDHGLRLSVEAPAGTTYTATVPVSGDDTVVVDGRPTAARVRAGVATVRGLSGSTSITTASTTPKG